MRNFIFTVALLCLTVNMSIGQVSHHSSFFDKKEHFYLLKDIPNSEGIVEGNVFENEEYSEGVILMDGKYFTIPIRYNIFLEAFEVKYSKSSFYIQSSEIDTVYYKFNPYIFREIDGEMKVFQVLYNYGNNSLLKKDRVKYYEGSTGVPFKKDVSPHFKKLTSEYYFLVNDNLLINISSFKNLYPYYPDKKESIKKFVKDNKIKKRDKASLIKLLGYISKN